MRVHEALRSAPFAPAGLSDLLAPNRASLSTRRQRFQKRNAYADGKIPRLSDWNPGSGTTVLCDCVMGAQPADFTKNPYS